MKTLFNLLFCLFFLNLGFGQEQQIYSAGKVHTLPVFQGCEKDSEDRTKSISCISSTLSSRIHQELKGFDEVLKQSGFQSAETTLQFLVSKEGVIIDIRPLQGGNPILGDAASIAMEKIAMELPPIQPAKLKNGTAVNVMFQLPFEFIAKKEENIQSQNDFEVDEIVLFTLIPNQKNLRYEVRLFKNKDIKLYEIQKDAQYFLGKFLTLNELERSDPYKSLIEKERKQGKTLVTDGFIGEEFFEIYIHNLFKGDPKKSIFVEVIKDVKGKKQSVAKFEKEETFNQSIFAPLIFRD
jgi:hypothetical protein